MTKLNRDNKIAISSLVGITIFFIVAALFLGGSFSFTASSGGQNLWQEGGKGEVTIVSDQVPSFVNVVKNLKPAVVNISTTKVVKGGGRVFRFFGPFGNNKESPFGDFFGDDFFNRFFGGKDNPQDNPDNNPQRDYKQTSLGSGFIINKDGYIITNNHVIEGADEIKVKLSTGKEYDAKIVGRDPKTDVALIQIKLTNDLPVIPFGDSDKLQVGEWVMAIGNPFGLDHTVTVGIVSAKGRVIGEGPYDDFIQTDASINPGNSGGPLINLKGEVVGINTAIVAGGQGIGFAIPINMAKGIIPQLKDKGKVTRGWLGVVIQKITPDLAKGLGLKEARGALVADVEKEGPADKAGVKRGDVIVRFNGKEITEMDELPRIVAATPVGKKVDVVILRNGKEMKVEVQVGEMTEKEKISSTLQGEETNLGINVANLTPDLKRRFQIKENEGVITTRVVPRSPADEAGLMVGDIIKEIDRKPIRNIADYSNVLKVLKSGEITVFLIKRGDTSLYVSLKIPSKK